MPTVAILGAGPLGSAIAHRLAQRGRVPDLLLVDESLDVASGKALDLQQSGPIEHFHTKLRVAKDTLSVTGADVIVVADEIASGEWQGERALAMLQLLTRAGTRSPLVFAGPSQMSLLERGYRELAIPIKRLVGTAPAAIAGAASALAGLELNLSGVSVTLVGRPPGLVAAWSAATVGGSLLSERIPGHRLLSLSSALTKLWPPGPLAIAAATAPVVEGLLFGSRRLLSALTIIDGELGARGKAVMLPLQIVAGGVLGHVMPSLSPQERTDMVTALAR